MNTNRDININTKFSIEAQIEKRKLLLHFSTQNVEISIDEAHLISASLVELAAYAQGLDPEVEDWARIPMQYLKIQTYSEDNNDVETIAHCWIKNQNHKNAFYIACGWLNEDGLMVSDLLSQEIVNEDYYGPIPDSKEYYTQALVDDTVFAYEEL